MGHLDKIFINDLQVEAILGINPEERTIKQPILLNLILFTDTRPAALSQDIADTINYAEVATLVKQTVENAEAWLVETLAEELAGILLHRYPLIQQLKLRIEKPSAIPFTRSVGIEIHRDRASRP